MFKYAKRKHYVVIVMKWRSLNYYCGSNQRKQNEKSLLKPSFFLLLTVMSTAIVRKGILSRVKRLIVIGIDL